MPEHPDLEIIREVLAPRLTGQVVTDVEVVRPLVVRDLTGQGFAEMLTGQEFTAVQRRGKVLLLHLDSGLTLAINCKLAGRLQYALPAERRLSKTHVVMRLSNKIIFRDEIGCIRTTATAREQSNRDSCNEQENQH